MKRGHVTGTKRETRGATDWYASIQAEHLARLDAEAQERGQMDQPNFLTIIHIAADSVGQLRACDLSRVVETAFEMGCLEALVVWLTAQRHDLDAAINEEVLDILTA